MTIATLERIVTRAEAVGFLKKTFPDGFGVRAIRITPTIATELLANNNDNRPIAHNKVRQYARDMATGNWPLNGESIIIAADGGVNDGQHRLLACMEAGAEFETIVVFGVDRDSRLTVDQGRARGAGCYLGMEGVPNANAIAAMCRMALAHDKTGGRSVEIRDGITNAEVMAFHAEHEAMLHAVYAAANVTKAGAAYASPSLFGFWAFLLRGYGECGLRYVQQINSGANIAAGDPAYVVRERLLALGKSRQLKTEAVLRGWAAVRDGRPLRLVRVYGGELPAI